MECGFDLQRELRADEDVKEIPKDDVFGGSFYMNFGEKTCRVMPEVGLEIKFTKIDDEEEMYTVNGKGTNYCGAIHNRVLVVTVNALFF